MDFNKEFANFHSDTSLISSYVANMENLVRLGLDEDGADDTIFGADFVYCGSHRTSHSTGWCTVSLVNKRPLNAKLPDDARAEYKSLGYRGQNS